MARRRVSREELARLKERAVVREREPAKSPEPEPKLKPIQVEVKPETDAALIIPLQEMVKTNGEANQALLKQLQMLVEKLEVSGTLEMEIIERDRNKDIKRLRVEHIPPTKH